VGVLAISAAIPPQKITLSAKQLLNQSEEVIRIAVAPQITMNIQWGKWGEYYYLEANTFSPKEFMSVIEETGGANAPPTIGLIFCGGSKQRSAYDYFQLTNQGVGDTKAGLY
jgi:hypothetical protein